MGKGKIYTGMAMMKFMFIHADKSSSLRCLAAFLVEQNGQLIKILLMWSRCMGDQFVYSHLIDQSHETIGT